MKEVELMKKLLALILALLMLCACSAEPEEIERELGGEPERGIIESGILQDYVGDDHEYTETEIFPEDKIPVGEKKAYDAVYYNKAFGIRIGENSPVKIPVDIIGDEYCELFANGSRDPKSAEFYDVTTWGGSNGHSEIDIRYENMPEFRGKALSEKEYAETALDEFAKRIEDAKFQHYDDFLSLTVLEKEIDTVKIDGENLYCLKYHVALEELNLKLYFGIALRRTDNWMTNIIVTYNYSPGMEYAAKCITFDN